MIFATAFVLFEVLVFGRHPHEVTRLAISLLSCVAVFSTVHCWMNSLTAHSVVFVSMLTTIVWKTSGLIKEMEAPEQQQHATRLMRRGAGNDIQSRDCSRPLIPSSCSMCGRWLCTLGA